MSKTYFLTLVATGWMMVTSANAMPERGYQARACGLDMDRNGRLGEAMDCKVCDGSTVDPDGDGVAEDILYVDCDGGADTMICGSAQLPCRTITYAWSRRADGPTDGVEDIICFRGICRDEGALQPAHGGVAGTYTVAAKDSAIRAWHYPAQPTMLLGWDVDADGVYPPVDPDDHAVLDGATADGRAFILSAANDFLEMAHFTVRDYGRFGNDPDRGFIAFGPGGGDLDHVYIHDLALEAVNMDSRGGSSVSAINLFTGALRVHWLSFENLQVRDNGAWFVRGAGPDFGPDVGPLRFRHISRTAHSCDFSVCGSAAGSTVFKLWGYLSGVEILDSVWDANVRAWEPTAIGGPSGSRFAAVAQCTQDWLLRNNEILDYKNALTVQGHASGFCADAVARPVDDIVFDSNIVRNTYEPWRYGDMGVFIGGGGDDPGETVGTVVVSNNFLSSTTGWEAAIWAHAGGITASPPGELVIAHNTLYGDINRHGAIVIGNVEGTNLPFLQERVVVKNNIVAHLGAGDKNVVTTYAPAAWVADANVFDPIGRFTWAGAGQDTLDDWHAASDGDTGSVGCVPDFVDPVAGDFHLLRSDLCAQDGGEDLSSVTLRDLDGEPRGFGGGWDAGADETGNTPPQVTILHPADGADFTTASVIAFAATASDGEDGDLSASIRWTSSRDGTFGAGATAIASLSAGTHTITAAAGDSGGLMGSAAIQLVIGSRQPIVIDWAALATVPYGGQDGTGTLTVEEDGATLHLEGNRWRRSKETFTLSRWTVLELTFHCDRAGEIHGIGFDEDDDPDNRRRIFQLFGGERWPQGLKDFRTLYTLGDTVTYRIPVGAFYQGTGFHLVVISDQDVAPFDSSSRFHAVRIYEREPEGATLP